MDEIGNGYYFRCQSCDRELDEFEQKKDGICTTCTFMVAYTARELDMGHLKIEHDIYRMFNPPMGGHDEFFDNFSEGEEDF